MVRETNPAMLMDEQRGDMHCAKRLSDRVMNYPATLVFVRRQNHEIGWCQVNDA